MKTGDTLKNIALTAGITTAATTAAALAVSFVETGSAAAGLNATSHIIWGDEAAQADEFDLKHTLVGAALNAGAMLAWSVIHAAVPRSKSPLRALAKGLAVSGAAYLTDYHLVPARLTPGFEKRFSPRGMSWMYGVLGAAFAVSGAVNARLR